MCIRTKGGRALYRSLVMKWKQWSEKVSESLQMKSNAAWLRHESEQRKLGQQRDGVGNGTCQRYTQSKSTD